MFDVPSFEVTLFNDMLNRTQQPSWIYPKRTLPRELTAVPPGFTTAASTSGLPHG
jgi:hypothetical protein